MKPSGASAPPASDPDVTVITPRLVVRDATPPAAFPFPATASSTEITNAFPTAPLSVVASEEPILHASLEVVCVPEVAELTLAAVVGAKEIDTVSSNALVPDREDLSDGAVITPALADIVVQKENTPDTESVLYLLFHKAPSHRSTTNCHSHLIIRC